jgi:hypothetical protein
LIFFDSKEVSMRRLPDFGVLLALLLSSFSQAGPVWDRMVEESATQPVARTLKGQSTPSLVSGLDLSLPGQDPAARAGVFVDRYRDLFLPGDVKSEVRVLRTVDAPYGPVVQMQQFLDGYRVFGGSLVVSEDVRGRTRMAVNGLRPLGDVVRSDALIGKDAAVELALAAFEQDGRETRGEPTVETVWWLSGGRIDKIHMVDIPAGIPLGDVTYLVGGPEGNFLFPLLRTSMARGYAYESSPLHNPTYSDVELLHLTSTTNLTGDNCMVKNCGGSSSYNCGVQQAQPDANGDYYIEPTGANDPDLESDSFVEVQAYYAINTIHDYVANAGLDASYVEVAVNWTYPNSPGAPNAVFSGGNPPTILIGQVNTVIDLALENDVIMHEYGHHVFSITSSTGWFEMDEYGPTFIAGALNEATADYYSCSCLGDPEIGEYWASIQPAFFPDGYMRTVDNEYTCPENLWGEVHADGIVWSGFLWKVRTLIGAAQADPLYLDVMAHFPSTTNFPIATQVYLERAALVLDAPTVDQIRAIAETRGLDDCERFIEVSAAGHECFINGRGMLPAQIKNMVPLLPGELHYFIDVPADATSLTLTEASAFADVVLLIRADEPVQHTFDWMSGLVSHYDFQVDLGGGTYDLLSPDAATPFEPGHTYYIHPTNRGDRQAISTIKGWTDSVAQDGGTDGGEDGGGTDGGSDAGADAGGGEDGGLPECPDGWDWTPQGCVPICKSGYKPKQEGDTWTCVPDDSGCGCGSGAGTGLGLWLLFGLALSLRRRCRK